MVNEEELIRDIQGELHRFDRLPVPEVPSIDWFEAKVLEQKKLGRKALFHDLLLFWLLTGAVFSVVITVFYCKPNVFFVMQGLVTLLLPFIVLLHKREKVAGE